MSHDLSLFTEFIPVVGNVHFGNNESLPLRGYGTVVFIGTDGYPVRGTNVMLLDQGFREPLVIGLVRGKVP